MPALLARLGVAPRRITADSRDVRAGRRVRRLPGRGGRRPRLHRRRASRAAPARCCGNRAAFAGTPAWQVPNVGGSTICRRTLGAIADFIYGHPSQALWIVGVTGTNGKTSCTHWIAQASSAAAGAPASSARSATVSSARSRRRRTRRRTPRCCTRCWRSCRRAGADAVAMEVSSHGLDQGRVNAVAFDVALFTNLTRDHLDYHGTMAAYGAAKARLFRWPGLAACGDQRRRPVRPEPHRRGARGAAARADLRPRQRRHRARPPIVDGRAAASRCTVGDAVGPRRARGAGSSARSTRRTCWACSACCSRATCRSPTRSPRSRAIDAAAGPHAAAGRRRRRRSSSSTTRTRPTRWRRCCSRCARPWRRAASSSACSAAAAIATPASGRRWAASPRALADRVVVTSDNPRSEDPAAIAERDRRAAFATPATAAGTSSSTARPRSRAAIARRAARRRRADRRQGPRGLPGARRRAHAVLRRRGRAPPRSPPGAAHDGHGAPPPAPSPAGCSRRQRAPSRA